MTRPDTDSTYKIRPLSEEHLDIVAGFEVEIAQISFGDEAITDPEFHKKRLRRSLGADGTFVATTASDAVVGWAFITDRQNASTDDVYGDFRSMFVAVDHRGGRLAFVLMSAVVNYARNHDHSRVVGRTSATNEAMQSLYRFYRFEPKHVVYELPLEGQRKKPTPKTTINIAPKTGGDAVLTRRPGAGKRSRHKRGNRRS